jgi:hypothetical protein
MEHSMIVRYSFHVRRKSGEAETELDFHTGEMPKEGKIANVPQAAPRAFFFLRTVLGRLQ